MSNVFCSIVHFKLTSRISIIRWMLIKYEILCMAKEMGNHVHWDHISMCVYTRYILYFHMDWPQKPFLSNLWSRPSQAKRRKNKIMCIYTMRISLLCHPYDFNEVNMSLFSRFFFSVLSYGHKRPYNMIWTVFRTRPNNVVRTQILIFPLKKFIPLLSVQFLVLLSSHFYSL